MGKLARIDGPNGYLKIPTYDSVGRPSQNTTTIAATSYAVTTDYDSAGRPRTLTYPSGFTARRLYNDRGYLASVDAGAGTTVYWQATTVDADGQVSTETLGNGVTTTNAFDPATGLPDTIQSELSGTTLQDLSFAFDYLGNLTSRGDTGQDRDEAFTYDGLNRVTGAVLTDTGTSTQLNASTYAYDSILGSSPRTNITDKSDVGAYTYGAGAAGPHAVTSAGSNTYTYDGNGNMTAGAGRTITWTSFNKPTLIDDTPTGNQTVFTYGPGRARIQQSILRGGLTTTVTYIGATYEKHARLGEDDELIHYIRAGVTVAIYTEIDDGTTLTDKTRYVHRDHLGSVTAMSDEAGVLTETLSYDPHGQRRQADWQPGIPAGAGSETARGFTGHEMLDGVNLIHMNGRVYDPVLGRFLSADPFVTYSLTTQGFNRYTYVNNNPLSFTDPSGFDWEDDPDSYGPDFDPYSGGEQDERGWLERAIDTFFDAVGDVLGAVGDVLGGILGGTAQAQQTTQPMEVGGVYITGHIVGGQWHTAIQIQDPVTGVTSWVSAGPVGGNLVSGVDEERPTDAPENNTVLGTVTPPEGISPSDFFERVLELDRAYCDCLDYDAFAGANRSFIPDSLEDGYNSNGFTRGLMEAAGGTSEFDFDDTIGGNRAVEPENFGF